LILDNEPQLTALMRDLFAATGRYVIKVESRNAHLLRAARHFRPDLLLAGALLPRLDGRDLARQLRYEPALRDIAVVFLTSLEHGAIGLVGYLAGFTFEAEPFQITDLIRCVDEILCEELAEPAQQVA
jgi:CheY-like chemotaxis protein